MGGLFKSKTKVTKAPYEQNPWEPQQPYLKEGFSNALEQLNSSLGAIGNIKDPVANLNQIQANQITAGINLGNQAQKTGQNLSSTGTGLLGQFDQATANLDNYDQQASQLSGIGDYYAQGMNSLANRTQAIGQQQATAGTNAYQQANQFGQNLANQAQQNQAAGVNAGNALVNQAQANKVAGLNDTKNVQRQGYATQQAGVNAYGQISNQANAYATQGVQGAQQGAQTATNIRQQANQAASTLSNQIAATTGTSQGVLSNAQNLYGNGSVDNIVADAQKVADNPYLQSQIDSAISDVQRGFQGDQANINASASASGNMNSSRAGVLEAKALEAAQRNAANISTNMRSDAYNTGLSTALNNKSQNNALLNTQLGAGQQQLDINNQRMDLMNSNASNQLNSNAQYLQGQAQASDVRQQNVNNQLNSAAGAQDARNTNLQTQLSAAGMNADIRNSSAAQTAAGYGLAQDARNAGYNQTSNAYNTALSGTDYLMSGLNSQQNSNQLAGSLLGSAADTQMAGRTSELDALLNSTNTRSDLGQLGAALAQSGYDLSSLGNQDALNLASILQQQKQNEIDGKYNQAGMGLDLVSQYMAAIGGNYGSQGYNSTVTQQASPFQQVTGMVAALAGMGKKAG